MTRVPPRCGAAGAEPNSERVPTPSRCFASGISHPGSRIPDLALRTDADIAPLLEAVRERSGYDFSEYAGGSLRRRIVSVIRAEGLTNVEGLRQRVLTDPGCLERLVGALSVRVTSLFRDPACFLAFRRSVVPVLRTYPFIRIWHAGCSTGEEVYSMAILLREEGLYERCRIYATDINEAALRKARDGIFPLADAPQYADSYAMAGGRRALSDHYASAYGSAIFRSSLKDNILFSHHNLATDGSFNEFNVIFCRNVMIYFGGPLKQRAHRLLYDSLALFGVLALGSHESLRFTPREKDFEPLPCGEKLYRRIR
jgi:chemotaxis protein methyltransferase CheR